MEQTVRLLPLHILIYQLIHISSRAFTETSTVILAIPTRSAAKSKTISVVLLSGRADAIWQEVK
jgi:hypothetical protein